MKDRSGTSSQIISLPQGGGALHGIGEKFSPDLHTGTGNFTMTIAFPPGRNGLQPDLALVYSTGNGNGPFGLGWGLNLPGVSRKTSKGVPVFDDLKDTFILSGVEDLVPIQVEETQTSYRPRTEGLFARIIHHRDPSGNHWKVQSKDGLTSWYGKVEIAGLDPAVIAKPDQRDRIFAWKLTRIEDPFGNRIEFEYQRDTGVEGPHHWDQIYLQQIRYAEYEGQDVTKFLVSVTLEYEDRHDPFSDYSAGFEIRTRKRCKRISVQTHAEQDLLVRSYDFIYLDERVVAGELPEAVTPRNGVSLLSQIRVIGHDERRPDEEDRTEELPPLEFAYTLFDPEIRDFVELAGPSRPAESLANREMELADLFGNGLPDLFQMNGTVRYWRNLGEGRFDLPREMRDAPAGLHLAASGVQLIDANGDGRVDLLVTTEQISGYFSMGLQGEWDRRSFQRYTYAPTFNLEDPEVQLIDLDGDGITDAIRSGSRFEYFFNDPREGWNRTRRVERLHDLESFPDINFSDSRVRWADMTGDGLRDIVLMSDGNLEYWPNLGHGNWGKQVHMERSPRFPYGYDPKRILIGDVDGDGLADLIYVDQSKVILYINQSGNGWSDPIEIRGTPPVSDQDALRLVDMLGTGVSGVLWSKDASATGRPQMFFLDLIGAVKPYLMNAIDNHMGAVTRIEYTPSTRFYLQDQKDWKTRWKTTLPFPVQVVARVEMIDELSGGKLTSEYRYHHGCWDGGEREFRGFGMVEQLDTEVFEKYSTTGLHGDQTGFVNVERDYFSPPILLKTWFHHGPVGEEFGDWYEPDYSDEHWQGDSVMLKRPAWMTNFLKALPRRIKRDALRTNRGTVLRTELYALDGTERENNPYTVTESLYGIAPLPVGDDWPAEPEPWQTRVFFPHILAQRTTQWERGNDPMTQITFTDDYDTNGQPRSQTQIACPHGWRKLDDVPGAPYLATRTQTVFAQPVDSNIHIHNRVAKATTYEIKNDGNLRLFDVKNTPNDSASLEVISQTFNYYDGEAFVGLPLGQIGKYGVVTRTESLVLTDAILKEAYKSGETVLDPPEIPPYLLGELPTFWPAEYPQTFRDQMPPLAGYIFYSDQEHAEGYFVATSRKRYDFHGPTGAARGMLEATRDPLDRETTISYDPYNMMTTRVVTPAGLTAQAVYDYRVFQPREFSDPNGNRTGSTFTPLGLVESMASMGEASENIGDTFDSPGTRFEYDYLAFADRRQPVSVRTILRVHHINDQDVPLPDRNDTIETIEYSDGFGRLLQTRTRAPEIVFGEPAFGADVGLPADQAQPAGDAIGVQLPGGESARVAVSGWQVYDNKGRVVEKYEPFFAASWNYHRPEDSQIGQKVIMFYDPRGRVIRTINPNKSEHLAIYGIPDDLENPEIFTPSPWQAYFYDQNDNAGRTHATGDPSHWNTPASIEINALGHTIKSVLRNGPDNVADSITTQSTYDIRGNPLTLIDPLGRVAFRYVYDLADNPLRIESLDAGLRRMVFDVMGNEIERRDSKGAFILQAFDTERRPVRLWARDDDVSAVTLREVLIYGDSPDAGLSSSQAAQNNLLGRLFRHYDEAGSLVFENYDFKGNILTKIRQVISNQTILSVFHPPPPNWHLSPFVVDWQPQEGTTLAAHAGGLLDSTGYITSATYDALNRIKTVQLPEDVNHQRRELRPRYNHAGALEHLELDGTPFVEHIAYNARGQRALIAYGNGVMTRYTCDPTTFRLVRMRTERYITSAFLTYNPQGEALQDLAYQYDLAGNIVKLMDRTAGSGIPNTQNGIHALDRLFTYDPLYRLLSATGREHAVMQPDPPWEDAVRSQDSTLTRAYMENYSYDEAGNILQMQHYAIGGSFVREFTPASNHNRLETMSIGQSDFHYAYDANGNLIRENTSRHFVWDHDDRMKIFRTQTDGSEPSVHADYLYDTTGQRVKKLVRKGGGKVEVTVYVDGFFEHHTVIHGSETQQNNTLHIMDNQSRIATRRVGTPFPDDTTPSVKFQLGDHLGSSALVLDNTGAWISREEFTPYGETSFGGFRLKRFRLMGKERDEESSLYYSVARYYAPWVARWVSTDPLAARSPATSPYVAFGNAPVNCIDPTGEQDTIATMQMERDVEALLQGKMTEEEFKARQEARAMGVAVGGVLALSAIGIYFGVKAVVIQAAANPVAAKEIIDFAIGFVDPHPPGASPLDDPTSFSDDIGRIAGKGGRGALKEIVQGTVQGQAAKRNIGKVVRNVVEFMAQKGYRAKLELSLPAIKGLAYTIFKSNRILKKLAKTHSIKDAGKMTQEVNKILTKFLEKTGLRKQVIEKELLLKITKDPKNNATIKDGVLYISSEISEQGGEAYREALTHEIAGYYARQYAAGKFVGDKVPVDPNSGLDLIGILDMTVQKGKQLE